MERNVRIAEKLTLASFKLKHKDWNIEQQSPSKNH